MNKWPILSCVTILMVLLAACNLMRTTSPDEEIARPEEIENNISDDKTEPTIAPPTLVSEKTPAVSSGPVAKPTATISLLSTDTDISVTPEEILSPEPTEPPSQPSITETPIPLPQPTDSPTIPQLVIDLFRANVEVSDPGETITLEWATHNAITVTLWKLAPTGQFSVSGMSIRPEHSTIPSTNGNEIELLLL